MGETEAARSRDGGRAGRAFLTVGVLAGLLSGIAAGLIGGYFAGFTVGGDVPEVKVFVVVPYHWGFAIFDADGNEVDAIEVDQGNIIQLLVMPASAMSHGLHEQFEEKIIMSGIGDLAPGNETREAVEEAEELGLMTHTLTIAEYGIEIVVTGNTDNPAEAHKVVRFEADKKGIFDMVCQRYCGAGHPWMTLLGGLVVT